MEIVEKEDHRERIRIHYDRCDTYDSEHAFPFFPLCIESNKKLSRLE